GKNAYPFHSFRNGTFQTTAAATVTATGDIFPLSQTQTHHSFEGRNVIREASFTEYKKDAAAGSGKEGEKEKMFDLWENTNNDRIHARPVYDWVMAIDLNA